MPELKPKPRTTTTTFFPSQAQMKLLPRKAAPHHDKSHFKKSYRWILWFSLSLYLFLFSHKSKLYTKPQQTSSSSSTPSLKIYIYDLPSKYNTAWLSNPRCSNHLFAAEVALHESLLHSPSRTLNPNEADFFFMPVYVSCNFSTPNGFPSLTHARPLLASAVHLVSTRFAYWNRSNGHDHVFVASHDYGACFHAMEDVATMHGIPEFMKSSVILQTFGVKGRHVCQEAEHVIIPPYIPPEILEFPEPETVKRDIFVFFRGKMEVHPKNISGRYYSKKVRTEIWNKFNGNRKFYLKRKRFNGYQSEIARSVFCLCPLGWAPWSPRLVESVALGCVPVIIADGIRLPFPDAVKWPFISLTVPERDVTKLDSILDHVTDTNLTDIQRNLWDPEVRKALLFSRRMEEGDATWHVVKALEKRKISRVQLGESRDAMWEE